jgi:hypothetical protein
MGEILRFNGVSQPAKAKKRKKIGKNAKGTEDYQIKKIEIGRLKNNKQTIPLKMYG